MTEFPFKIPKSLTTYAEQFKDDPLKVTTKLKNHLEKRGPDAVGYFLLAWFYHLKGMKDQAIKQALKAKAFAPGSALMEKLHYYLSHPDAFDAWTPEVESDQPSQKQRSRKGPEPVLDLDDLITRLSKVDSDPISIPNTAEEEEIQAAESGEDDVDNIASETLAKIHEMQGKTKAAINTYERLKKIKKDKTEYYNEQIERLKREAD
jgi:tetratricopeptide (TPR) repeat protein